MSYIQLKADTATYAHRTDIDGQMDTFVTNAEAIINKELRVSEMQKITPVSYTEAFNDLPTDFIEMRSFSLNSAGLRSIMPMVTPDQLVGYDSNEGFRYNATAFALHGGQIEIRPDPNTTTPLTGDISYYAKVLPLVSNATNDVLDNYPMLYLAAMVTQVYTFLQDDTELAKWDATFNTQLLQANKTSDAGQLHRPTIRVD